MDKNKAVVNFLLDCPYIASSPLFFNFGESLADNKQIITVATDTSTQKPFVDGSVSKRFVFTVIDYKAVANRPLIDADTDENLEEMLDVQSILEWVNEQGESRTFPDFGEDCVIDRMEAVTDQPNLNGVDRSSTPALAKYSISIRIEYIDYSKSIWDKKGA